MGRFLSPLRASIEALLRARDPRAQREDRLIPSPPTHDDVSTTTHPRSARTDSWLILSPAAVRLIDES